MGNTFEDVVSADGSTLHCTYFSLDEFADAAQSRAYANPGRGSDLEAERSWAGGTLTKALELARMGWEDKLTETLALVESAISMTEKNHEVETFQPTWDVSGAEVDVARYLSGEPENMIDFPMARISKLGKVITVCGSIAYSAAIDPDVIIRRGQVLAAFAIILTRLGYASELWVDMTVTGWRDNNHKKVCVKVQVKGPNDTTDVARILYAYAHPTTLRRLMFAVENGLPKKWWDEVCSTTRGTPAAPIRDLPEGTIYLPELRRGHNVPDAHELLKDMLRQAGLLAEGV